MRLLHPAAEARARAVIGRSVFAREADRLIRLARPLVRLDAWKGKGKRRSWLGGTPALPAGVRWPTWCPAAKVRMAIDRLERALAAYRPRGPVLTETGQAIQLPDPRRYQRESLNRLRSYLDRLPRPLSFLGQVDLAEAGDAVDCVGLPRSGILWFFQDADLFYGDSPESWRVIYRDIGSESLVERATPKGAREFNRTPVILRPGIFYDREPSPRKPLDREGAGKDPGMLWLDLMVKLRRPKGSVCSLGGGNCCAEWCRQWVHHLAMHGGRKCTPEEWERIKRESLVWRCLLCLESDDRRDGPGWQWGDCGAMTYWVHKDAWQRSMFDQAWAYMDTT